MSITIGIIAGLILLVVFLLLRKKWAIFAVEQIDRDHFYIGLGCYYVPQLDLIKIERVSRRKFKGSKEAKLIDSNYYDSLYEIEGNYISSAWLCKDELKRCFWCIPKIIYYV